MKTLILSLMILGAAASAHAELTPDEQSFAAGLSDADRAKYTATREYVHRAEAIIKGGANPLSLGSRPSNVDTQYYQGNEAADVSKARTMSNMVLMRGIKVTGTA